MLKSGEIWLSLDLSSLAGSLALHRRGEGGMEELGSTPLDRGGRHSEQLLVRCRDLLGDHGLTLNQVDRFVTTSGPGSFTGLRIALASLKAFAYSRNRPLELVSASEARLRAAWGELELPQECWVVTRAGRARFVVAHFLADQGEPRLISERLEEAPAPSKAPARGSYLLLDEGTAAEPLPPPWKAVARLFSLHARHLSLCLEQAQSRETAATPQQWMELTPRYFGTPYRKLGDPR